MHRNQLQQNVHNNIAPTKTHFRKTSGETFKLKQRNKMPMVWKNIQRTQLTTKAPKNTHAKHNMANRQLSNKNTD